MIVHGQLASGQRLYEHDLAARMSISRTPVREAIRQLEREGLVTVFPNRETVVTALTPDDVREIYQYRAAIEGMAAYLAAQAPSDVALAPVSDVLARMEVELQAANQAAYLDLDIAFHDAVVRASGNSRLVEARLRIRDQTRRYLVFTLARVPADSLRRNLGEHRAIVDAIRAGDAQLAEQRMRTHVIWNGERIARAMSAAGAGG
jgi:DNA-binding GntR family transcriptional regulator